MTNTINSLTGKQKLLIDFAKFIAEHEMYTHNDNCFSMPGGETYTSEQLADHFLSQPEQQEKEGEKKLSTKEELESIGKYFEDDIDEDEKYIQDSKAYDRRSGEII